MARIRKTQQPTVKNIVWKIALYIRLSKEDGNDESLSVGNQRKILLEYVNQCFEDDYEIVDTYIDDGNTGTDTERPSFRRIEQDIKNGGVNCIIVKSLSRAFRNLGDQTKFLDEFLPLHNVRFICIGSPLVDTYKNGKNTASFEVPIYGMFNEQFAAATSEEIRKTFNTKRRQGEFIGAFTPYGFLKSPENKNRLIVDENAAAVVKDIFAWFLYGISNSDEKNRKSLSMNGIAQELNERGISSPMKYKQQIGLKYKNPHHKYSDMYWTATSVSKILKDRMYTGDMVQGKYRVISYKIHKQIITPQDEWFIVENTHEAIINKEMFEKVQKRLLKDTRTPAGKKELYLFSGFLRCADCGRALHRKSSGNYIYYFCRINQEVKGKCKNRSIREDKLTNAVLTAIQTQICIMLNLTHTIDKINRAPKVNNKSERLNALIKKHETEITKVTKTIDALYGDWKNGDITREEYLRYKSDYSDRRENLQVALDKVRGECEIMAQGITSENTVFKDFIKYKNIKVLTRDMLVDLIDTVFVHENGEITIKFNFTDQYQRVLDFIKNNEHKNEEIS